MKLSLRDEGAFYIFISYSPFTSLYKEVRRGGTDEVKGEMSTGTRTSGRDDEALEATESNAPVGGADSKSQAGSSTRLRAQAQKDGPFNSGEHSTIS